MSFSFRAPCLSLGVYIYMLANYDDDGGSGGVDCGTNSYMNWVRFSSKQYHSQDIQSFILCGCKV